MRVSSLFFLVVFPFLEPLESATGIGTHKSPEQRIAMRGLGRGMRSLEAEELEKKKSDCAFVVAASLSLSLASHHESESSCSENVFTLCPFHSSSVAHSHTLVSLA